MAAHKDEKEIREREEAKKILRDQLAVEGELVGLYEKSIGEIPNKLVRDMLGMIRIDSQRHISMLGVVLGFLEGEEVYMEDRRGLAESLRRHLELEAESIRRGEKILDQHWLRNRKGFRAILESWLEDERRHHRFLKELSEKPFTPLDSDDFQAVFRDEAFFEDRYRRSKTFWERERGEDEKKSKTD